MRWSYTFWCGKISNSYYYVRRKKKSNQALYETLYGGSPGGWSSGWESALQYRGHWFNPWPGRIPHAEGQLNLCITMTKPKRLRVLEPALCNRRSPHSAMKSSPYSLQLQKMHSNKDVEQPKINTKIYIFWKRKQGRKEEKLRTMYLSLALSHRWFCEHISYWCLFSFLATLRG